MITVTSVVMLIRIYYGLGSALHFIISLDAILNTLRCRKQNYRNAHIMVLKIVGKPIIKCAMRRVKMSRLL